MPQSSQVLNGRINLGRLNEIIGVKLLAQCLAHNRCSFYVSYADGGDSDDDDEEEDKEKMEEEVALGERHKSMRW